MLLAASAALPGGMAAAQTLQVVTGPGTQSIGNVTAGISGNTVFNISTSGNVTVASGTGSRQTAGTVPISFTIRCTNGSGSSRRCDNAQNSIKVRITPGAVSGRAATLAGFAISGGTNVQSGPTTSGASTTFVLNPLTSGTNTSFNLGMDFPITGGFGPSGSATAAYTIAFGFDTNYSAASTTGSVTATTRNPTQIAKDTDLRFGNILRLSNTATGTVTVNASSGAISSSNTNIKVGNELALGLRGVAGRAQYSITTESGQTISISVPGSLTLSGPGGSTLSSTLVSSAGTSITPTSSANNSATATVGVGGTLTIPSNVTPGTYTGSFNVTFSWN